MKQKDIALIIVIVFISGVVSFFVSRAIFASPKSRGQQVQVVQPITADFPTPSDKYFNTNSIDPTQPIQIDNNNNTSPFSSGQD